METQTERLQLLITRLYDAALQGDVPALLNVLRDDPLILDRCIIEKSCRFVQSPLHVAANHGHLEFTIEVLRRKPELAEELDQSKRWSPLHMASSKGHLEILNALLAVKPDMCFIRDLHGRNAVHVAAVNGQVQALDVLLRARPQAARERTTDWETILHLCVKHRRSEALVFLIQTMGDGQLLNSKDINGNTILHLAVAAKHYETIDFLLKDKRMAKNTINTNGLTAMDTCIQNKKDGHDGALWLALRRAKVLRAKVLQKRNSSRDWLDKQRTELMVVSSLITTMAFQAGINPPGGIWQDDTNGHKAGTSIMAKHDLGMFDAFLISNTIALVSSMSVIILLISGLRCMKLFMGMLMGTMWMATTATIMTYFITSVYLLEASEKDLNDILFSTTSNPLLKPIMLASTVWVILLDFLILRQALHFFAKLIKQIIRVVIEGIRNFSAKARNPPV